MLTLRYNPATERFDCYANSEYVATLTCGTKFNLYSDDEEIIVAGGIGHHLTHGYYFVDDNGCVMYLYSELKGTLNWVSFIISETSKGI